MSAARTPHPPRLTRWLLRGLLPAADAEFVAGDLDEEFRHYATAAAGARAGRMRAGIWYRLQAVRTLWSFARGAQRAATAGAATPARRARGERVPTPSAAPQESPLRSPGGTFMSTLWQDLRYTVRNLRRAPGFTVTAALTLGLGIGATTAMFSAVNEVMLRPLPFAEPDRLVMLYDDNAQRGWHQVEVAPANAFDWRQQVEAFEDVALASPWTSNVALRAGDEAVAAIVAQVSGNLFSVLGAPPLHGRVFTFEETWADAGPPVVLLGHDVWRRRFNADPSIVGESLLLDGVAHEVVGVMGAEFRYDINDAEMWVPYRWQSTLPETVWFRQAHVAHGIARLAPGVSIDEARSELAAVGAQLRQEYPQLNLGMEPGLVGLQSFLVGDRSRTLLLLLGAVALLQLIACANVANLLLVRAGARGRELAVRAALGAGRLRLLRLVSSEAVLLSVAGSVLGLLLAVGAMRWLETIRPPELPELVFRADVRVLAFTIALAAGSALLFSLAPMVRTAGLSSARGLTEGSRTGSGGPGSTRIAGGIVSLEVALAVVLVIGAGLLVRTLIELSRVDTRYDPASVLTFELRPPAGGYPRAADREAFAYRVIDELEALPGVVSVGATRGLPFTGYGWSSDFSMEGWGPEEFGIDVRHRAVTSGYFEALAVPLIEGEIFADERVPSDPVPVVVNRAFAERYFPDGSPVGRRVAFDRHPDDNSFWYPIVGVVDNEPMQHAVETAPEIISHFAGDTPNTIRFGVAAEVPPETLIEPAREAVARLDPGIPFVLPRTMEQVAADALLRERFLMTLLTTFGGAALLLAAVGVYGVAAQGARARTREIGIRMALGARAEQITAALLRRAAAFVVLGLSLGLIGAAVGGRMIEGWLHDVAPSDPVAWILGATLLAAVALTATYLPARRASRANPAAILHEE